MLDLVKTLLFLTFDFVFGFDIKAGQLDGCKVRIGNNLRKVMEWAWILKRVSNFDFDL